MSESASFKKSSFCVGGVCAEVAVSDQQVVVRRSDNATNALEFSHQEWEQFIRGVKAGEFDPPSPTT